MEKNHKTEVLVSKCQKPEDLKFYSKKTSCIILRNLGKPNIIKNIQCHYKGDCCEA